MAERDDEQCREKVLIDLLQIVVRREDDVRGVLVDSTDHGNVGRFVQHRSVRAFLHLRWFAEQIVVLSELIEKITTG